MDTILIVDDDVAIGNLEQLVLERAGYNVLRAYSGTEAVLLLKGKHPNLILLDLMLPGLSGEEVLDAVNARGIPVIVVSAKAAVDDKVNLLMGGAVDYMTKPFDTKELLARVAVHLRGNLRRSEETQAKKNSMISVYECGDIVLDVTSRTVEVSGRQVPLTRTEFAILKLLMQNPGQVIAKSIMLDRISGDTPDCTESSLKTHISHLRSKLREASGMNCDYVEAVWGIGFKLNVEPKA